MADDDRHTRPDLIPAPLPDIVRTDFFELLRRLETATMRLAGRAVRGPNRHGWGNRHGNPLQSATWPN